VRSDSPDDHQRSLTPEGRERARVLAALLGDQAHGEIVSSPFARCVETVEPLAARLGRTVVLSDLLAEGAEAAALLDLLRSLPDGTVVCTHGDMMTKLALELEDARSRSVTEIQFDKGVVWVLSRENLSLSLVDEIGPSTRPDRRDQRIPYSCAASSARSRRDGQRSMSHG
jgi:8-oxo-dGTP diphosphatase